MHLLCALGVYTGMRKNELANARWSWIDFKGRGRILIQNEGRFQTKSGKPRKISMSSRLRAILERYDEDGDRYILAPKPFQETSSHSLVLTLPRPFACERTKIGVVSADFEERLKGPCGHTARRSSP